ncbi:hypothetical protein [Arthrobacter sp.]|uniref:hypothetical protein n=1 Tax=Arthrobacter sp. TaxID=1667 RepID=UPI0033954E15
MSLCLNKALGYALTNLVDSDPRINQDSPLLFWSRFEEDDEDFVVPTLESYAFWLEEKAAAVEGGFGTRSEAKLLRNARALRLHRMELTDAVVHQDESGPETLVLIPPVSLHNWCRADDPIDFIEASLLEDGGRDNSLILPGSRHRRLRSGTAVGGSALDPMTTEQFTVTADVDYRPFRVPPRCRKARPVPETFKRHIDIPSVTSEDAPVGQAQGDAEFAQFIGVQHRLGVGATLLVQGGVRSG